MSLSFPLLACFESPAAHRCRAAVQLNCFSRSMRGKPRVRAGGHGVKWAKALCSISLYSYTFMNHSHSVVLIQLCFPWDWVETPWPQSNTVESGVKTLWPNGKSWKCDGAQCKPELFFFLPCGLVEMKFDSFLSLRKTNHLIYYQVSIRPGVAFQLGHSCGRAGTLHTHYINFWSILCPSNATAIYDVSELWPPGCEHHKASSEITSCLYSFAFFNKSTFPVAGQSSLKKRHSPNLV